MKGKIKFFTALVTLACMICSMLPCAYAEDASAVEATEAVEEKPMFELATWSKKDLPDVKYIVTDTSQMDGEVIDEIDFEDGKLDTSVASNFGWGGTRKDVVVNSEGYGGSSHAATFTVPKGASGLQGLRFTKDLNFRKGDIYEVSFMAKCSEDFNGKIHFSFFTWREDEGPSVWSRYTQYNGGYVPKSDEWTECRIEILISLKRDYDPAMLQSSKLKEESDFQIGELFIAAEATDAKGSGELYIDNICVRKITEELEYPPRIATDENLAWYNADEKGVMPKVKLTPEHKARSSAYPRIKGRFYDVYNNVVATVEYDTDVFNAGITWIPPKAGYYEYEFALIDNDGVEHPWCEWYTCFNNEPKYYYRRSLVVTPRPTKPMAERNHRFGGYTTCKDYVESFDDVEMLDKLGFSIMRIHGLNFGNTAASTSTIRGNNREIVAKEKGVYDFSYYDELINHARDDYGFEDIEVTIFSIPNWANPTMTASGAPSSVHVVPIDDSVYVNQVRAAAKHFKGRVTWWEPFNEPGTPGESIFFSTTPERYFALHKAAYEAIKEEDPDAKVSLETPVGMVFPKRQGELGINKYMDALHIHGGQGESVGNVTEYRYDFYKDLLVDENGDPMPVSNTEIHNILRRAGSVATDYQFSLSEAEMAIVGIKAYLANLKIGVDRMISFGAVSWAGCDDAERGVYRKHAMNTSPYDNASFFRVRPVVVPRMVAMAIWQFVDQAGSEQFEYVNEKKLNQTAEIGEKSTSYQNAVHLKNNGKDQLLMWLDFDIDEPQKLSKRVTDAAIAGEFKIEDFHFNTIDTSDLNNIELQPETLYYISGIDGDAYEKGMESGWGISPISGENDMRFGDVLYNCAFTTNGISIDPSVKIPEGNATKTELFDPKTFEIRDNINWISDDIKWVQNASQGTFEKNIDAKFAVYVDQNRLQVLAKVYGDEHHRPHSKVNQMWWGDSIQISLDALGFSTSTGFTEIIMAGDPGRWVKVFKQAQMQDNALVDPNLTKANNQIPNDHGSYNVTFNTEQIDGQDVNVTTYFMEVPMYELAPYAYPDTDEKKRTTPLRFSLLINQNQFIPGYEHLFNGQQAIRVGYLEWSTGIGADKTPWYFGKIWIPTEN